MYIYICVCVFTYNSTTGPYTRVLGKPSRRIVRIPLCRCRSIFAHRIEQELLLLLGALVAGSTIFSNQKGMCADIKDVDTR